MDYADEDIDLMLRLQNGDEQCFETIVDRHKQRVFNIAYRYVGNVHDAQDIAQQVFINVYNARKSYVPTAHFATWLYTVCKNTCLKSFRRKRLKTVSIDADYDPDREGAFLQVSSSEGTTPLDDAIRSEHEQAVNDAIDALPDNQRMALILFKYEQLPYEKIAEITGFSQKAVKSLLHRARVTLKEKLAHYFRT